MNSSPYDPTRPAEFAGPRTPSTQLAAGGDSPDDDGTQVQTPLQMAASAAASAQSALSVPGYVIAGELARGGMGVVMAARDLALDREVAIKVLLGESTSPSAAARFTREAKIIAQLSHPGIPPIHALGVTANGAPFLAMKLIRGRTLADLLRERPTPQHDASRFVQIFEQIALAVGFAHSQGIIHRDLKPVNVMVGAFGEVQVMDWGLAKILAAPADEDESDSADEGGRDSSVTQAGAVMGTPAYMAPEQARGEVVDARADVFSLGAILCAVLTGESPFGNSKSVAEAIARSAAGDVAAAFARLDAQGADAELAAVAKSCLAKSAGDRPANAKAVADAVAAYRTAVEQRLRHAESARAASEAKALEQRKRRRFEVIAAAAIFAVLAVGGALSSWQAFRATKAKAETAQQLKLTRKAEADYARSQTELGINFRKLGEKTLNLGQSQEAFDFFTSMNVIQQRLAAADPTNIGIQSDLSRSFDRLGDVALQLGRTLDAHEFYQKGLTIRQTLFDADATNVNVQVDLGLSFEHVGTALLQQGRTREGIDYYLKGLSVYQRLAESEPANVAARRGLSVGYSKLGDASMLLGQSKKAHEYYRSAHEIQQRRAAAEPGDVKAQHDLGASFGRFGNAMLKLGDSKAGIDSYRSMNETFQRMVNNDPNNMSLQRDLNNSFLKLGDGMQQHGQTSQALDVYLKANRSHQRLVNDDPSAQARRNLSVSFDRLGAVSRELGQTKEAFDYYQQACELQQHLFAEDAKNVRAERDLSQSYEALGSLSLELRQTQEALDLCRKRLDISRRLALADAKNTVAQRDLSNGLDGLGDVLLRLGRTAEALDLFQQSLKTRQARAIADPDDAQAKSDLSVTFEKLGDATLRLGQTKEALDGCRDGLSARQALADIKPSVGFIRLGDTASPTARTMEALDFYHQALAIREKLVGADPQDAQAQRDLLVSFVSLGDVEQLRFEFAAARGWYDKALAVTKKFERPDFFKREVNFLGEAIAGCRNAEKAIAGADFIFEQKPDALGPLFAVRMNVLLHRKQLADAVASADRYAVWAETQDKTRNDHRYDAACFFARCAALAEKEKEPLIDKAIALLRKAKADGYFVTAKIAHIQKDSDFDGLRTHSKFVALLAELK